MKNQKHILVSPLDWGLGHATRSIPVIRELMLQGHKVSIASSGQAYTLLKGEFPELMFFQLPSYQPTYSNRIPLFLKLFFQLPKFLWVIVQEHSVVEKIISEHKMDGVISDNRYGCWSKQVPSAFITHQVWIQLPKPIRCLSRLVNFFNHAHIRKFDQCWIPDTPDQQLSGSLTNNASINSKFVGHLSRFQITASKPKKYDVMILISGPEPQRTLFEKLCIAQLTKSNLNVMLVQGLPEKVQRTNRDSIEIVNHLESGELADAIIQSDIIVSRSGYSSLMDLTILHKKKLILIPTPGQTEQEYLAQKLASSGVAVVQSQNKLDLKTAFTQVNTTKGFVGWNATSNLLTQTIAEWLR